jgi:hypothetical protein
MLTLFLFLCLLPTGNLQAEQQLPMTPDDGYVLPKYPALPARAYVNADYELALEIEQGTVMSIKVLSGPTGDAGLGNHFVPAMESAIKRWRFRNVSPGIRYLKVSFRSFKTNSEEGKPTYYIYRVDASPFGSENPPSKITIEYHLPVPELVY